MEQTGRAVRHLACRALSGLGLLAVAGVCAASAAAVAAPRSGVWSVIAPAIDGPNAKQHTVLHFTIAGSKVENFGDALAGGSVNSVAGSSICSALMRFPSAPIHGSSFSSVLSVAGGSVIFKGTFTSATTARGTWEETNPCYTNVIVWTAKAGGTAPSAAGAAGTQTNATGAAVGNCSPKPCGNDDGVIVQVLSIDRHAVGPNGQREVYLKIRVKDTSETYKFLGESLDFALKFPSGKLSGWPSNDNAVKLSDGATVNCGWWTSPEIGTGHSYGPVNVCFTGSSPDLGGPLSLAFGQKDEPNKIDFPLG